MNCPGPSAPAGETGAVEPYRKPFSTEYSAASTGAVMPSQMAPAFFSHGANTAMAPIGAVAALDASGKVDGGTRTAGPTGVADTAAPAANCCMVSWFSTGSSGSGVSPGSDRLSSGSSASRSVRNRSVVSATICSAGTRASSGRASTAAVIPSITWLAPCSTACDTAAACSAPIWGSTPRTSAPTAAPSVTTSEGGSTDMTAHLSERRFPPAHDRLRCYGGKGFVRADARNGRRRCGTTRRAASSRDASRTAGCRSRGRSALQSYYETMLAAPVVMPGSSRLVNRLRLASPTGSSKSMRPTRINSTRVIHLQISASVIPSRISPRSRAVSSSGATSRK